MGAPNDPSTAFLEIFKRFEALRPSGRPFKLPRLRRRGEFDRQRRLGERLREPLLGAAGHGEQRPGWQRLGRGEHPAAPGLRAAARAGEPLLPAAGPRGEGLSLF